MLGFRNRKKYNGSIDAKLTGEYKIVTDGDRNSKFPGVIKYLEMIDQAWNAKFTEEEAAMFIATLYYSGLKQNGHHEDAHQLAKKLSSVGQSDYASGKIGMQRLQSFMTHIEKANEDTKALRQEDNSGAGYAVFCELMSTGRQAGFIQPSAKFWLWAERELGSEVTGIGFDVLELIRTKLLFKEEHEMNSMSLTELEGMAAELYKLQTGRPLGQRNT